MYDLQLSRWVIHMPNLKIALMQVTENPFIFEHIPKLQELYRIHEDFIKPSKKQHRDLLSAVIQLIEDYPVIPAERILMIPKVH